MAKTTEEKPVPESDKIVSIGISSEMKDSFLAYSMSVITSRALPDVRDGLKPVHRRILYAMQEAGLTSSSRFKKSATIVGDVLGKYHPHGDSSVYDAMVGMAQDFSYRYPLVIGQGNFGSIDGDNAAAYRYTEAKMSKISGELLRDLEKETVDFRPNYDGSKKEPVVFPAAVPTLLLNGTLGIAVGMATNIPPHNLGEVVDACVHLIDDPKATNEDLLQFVQGPDFPLGGVIYGASDIAHAYATGRGGVVTRGEADISEEKGGGRIVIRSIPYRVNKATLIMRIAELVQEKKLQGIRDLRDESTTDIRVVIDLKQGVMPERVLNFIYKHTELESNFNFNMVALVDGVPQTLSLKDILESFIKHRQEVIKRRTEFDLRKAEERAHILEGLKKALDQIDAVIKTIKASKDSGVAKVNLIQKFKFSEIQALAILDMKLQKLAGLERKNIEDELAEKLALIKELKALLASEKRMLGVVKTELIEVKKNFADERRTRVVKKGVGSISDEDLIPQVESALVFTLGGYVKRTDPKEYRKQKRGGVGVVDLDTKEEDIVTQLLVTNTHNDLLFFTDQGKVYVLKMYDIPEGRRATKGKSIMNFLPLTDTEHVTSILPVPKDTKGKADLSLFFVTKQGIVKKVASDSFANVRRSGLIAINLHDKDELLDVCLTEKGDTMMLTTQKGQSIHFKESDVRQMGRGAAGVRGIGLKGGDVVVGADVVKKDFKNPTLLVITENGYGKKTETKEYKIQKRGGSGIKTVNVTSKTGKLIGAEVVTEEDGEVIVISKKSQVIRTDLETISVLGRATQGVRVMKLREGDTIASLTIL